MRWFGVIGCALMLGCGCGGGKKDSKDEPKKTVSDAALSAKPLPSDAAATKGPRKVVLAKAPPVAPAPRGLPETPSPKYNPTTPNKVVLGRLLFFDKRLSDKLTMSCDTCHIPEHGWADRKARSKTAAGTFNLRHTPSLYNVGYVKAYRWDGAMKSLEAFVLNHWRGQYATKPRSAIRRLRKIPEYRAHFRRSFDGGKMTSRRAVEAISAFVRTIRSGNSAWDKYELDNDESAVTKQAIAGAKLFRDTAQCGLCHPPPHYMDSLFHNKGIGVAVQPRDDGRAAVTKNDADTGAFRTPTLRGIGHSAPYFHDGSAATLDKAVGYTLSGGFRTNNKWLDAKLQAVPLSAGQKADLMAFLAALTPKLAPYKRPQLPPDPK